MITSDKNENNINSNKANHQPRLDAWDKCSGLHFPSALGRPRGIGWRGRWERELGWGMHVNPWLIHVNVWQKPLQYCKVISLQLIKVNGKKRLKNNNNNNNKARSWQKHSGQTQGLWSFECWLCLLPNEWFWASYLTSLYFYFLVC